MVYFDYAATTPIDSEALEVWINASQQFYGNSSSLHDYGSKAAHLLDLSRQQLSDLVNVHKESIIFTSGGTESNVLAIETLLATSNQEKKQIILSQMEHASLHQLINKLKSQNYEITYLHHLPDGTVDLNDLAAHLSEQTCIVIVQHVNSEIGIVQPIEQIKTMLKNRDVYLHVDCVQSFAKLPIETISANCDSIALSSHKVYGPKGVGAVVFPNKHKLKPALPNISHESGFRAGTVNVPGIAAFVTAARKLTNQMDKELIRIKELRSHFIQQLKDQNISFEVIQSEKSQLPHILALTFSGLQGQSIMIELNRLGFAVSTGSACQIDKQEPSKALIAIGKSVDEAHQLVRISFGKLTTEADVNRLACSIEQIVRPNKITNSQA